MEKRSTGVFVLLILILTSLGGEVRANDPDSTQATHVRRWYVPHFVPLQFAGNIGFFSLGAGYVSNHQNYELGILYGYVPVSIGNARIHTITAKNNFPLTRIALQNEDAFIPYLGLGLSVEVGGNAFFTMPSHFPESYYDFPKNLRLLAYGGVKFQHLFVDSPLFRGVELYAEAGTIDVYIWYKVISDQIRFNEIFTLALGVNFLLHR